MPHLKTALKTSSVGNTIYEFHGIYKTLFLFMGFAISPFYTAVFTKECSGSHSSVCVPGRSLRSTLCQVFSREL